jgi:tRNA(fMet)-specific endonuclease VapC
MTRFHFDTGIAGAYMDRRGNVRQRATAEVAGGNRIGICVPVLGELIFGIENSQSKDKNWRRLRAALADWRVWPYEIAAAHEYGRLQAQLRRLGRPMQQTDVQIAAIALVLGQCVVVSSDTDLLAVPGLTVENWAA